MKNLRICFLFLFVIFSLSCGQEGDRSPSGQSNSAAPISTPPQPQFGKLHVESGSIEEAKVYINTLYQGTTPLTLEAVPEGTHTLKVTKWGLEDEIKSTTILPNQETRSTISFWRLTPNQGYGGLIVDDTISGADIYLDGQYLGKTPYKNLQLPIQEDQLLRLQHNNFVYTQYIDVIDRFIVYIHTQKLFDATLPTGSSTIPPSPVSYACSNNESSMTYRDILLACFDDEKKEIMKKTMDFVYLDANGYSYPNSFSSSSWQSLSLMQFLSPTIQSIAKDPHATPTFQAAARHPLIPGTTELYDNALTYSFSGYTMMGSAMATLSSLLIHEALHGLGISHTGCSASDPSDDWQDPDDTGVYGTQAKQGAQLASLGNHPWLTHCTDRKSLYILAESYMQNSICNAQNRIDLRALYPYPNCSVATHFIDPDTNQLIEDYLKYRSSP